MSSLSILKILHYVLIRVLCICLLHMTCLPRTQFQFTDCQVDKTPDRHLRTILKLWVMHIRCILQGRTINEFSKYAIYIGMDFTSKV